MFTNSLKVVNLNFKKDEKLTRGKDFGGVNHRNYSH